MLKKEEKALKGKVVKRFENDSYYGVVRIHFTDGSYIHLTPYTTGAHNDRWSAIQGTYHE
jgi:hypothetical protein